MKKWLAEIWLDLLGTKTPSELSPAVEDSSESPDDNSKPGLSPVDKLEYNANVCKMLLEWKKEDTLHKLQLEKLFQAELGLNLEYDYEYNCPEKLKAKNVELNGLSSGVEPLFRLIFNGSLPELEKLKCLNTGIGDDKMIAFSKAIASGSLASLTRLELGFNTIKGDGMRALADAIAGRPLGKSRHWDMLI